MPQDASLLRTFLNIVPCAQNTLFSLLLTPTHPPGLRLNVTSIRDPPRLSVMPGNVLLPAPSGLLIERYLTFNCNGFFDGPSPPCYLIPPTWSGSWSVCPSLCVTALDTQLVLKKYV